MKTIDFSYFIERYNSGEMDSLEKQWFMKELDGNAKLKEEVSLRKRVDNALIKHDLIDLRNKLANLEKTRKEQVSTSNGKKAAAIRFAASVAVLTLLGAIFLLLSRNTINYNKLYSSNFEHYLYSGTSRTSVQTGDISFQTAVEFYNQSSFQAASSALNEYLKKNPENTEAIFLLGVSEMENNNFSSAIERFQAIRNDKDNLFLDRSQWYLSLCYVKTGKNNEAVSELEAIINSGSVFSTKARKLIKKLK